MRIISGEFRSRRLVAPTGDKTRPTPDRLRESLFSSIQHQIEGVNFTDLFAGTGAVGLEALSRGARHVCFVERDRDALTALLANIQSLGVGHRCTVVRKPVAAALDRPWDGIVFLDPPYTDADAYQMVLTRLGQSSTPTLVLAQHDKRLKLNEHYGALHRTRQLKQGDSWISYFAVAPGTDSVVSNSIGISI
jgi:16S rRNA (guanine(966)-N(2))-methyltransferase RsmD